MAAPSPRPELAAVTTWLIDTGPLVAYLDARDRAHEAVAGCLADFLNATATVVYDLSTAPELDEVVTLMERYRDTPMDYADGTLVRLADALDVFDVLTLDRRGFLTYRAKRNRRFRLVLDAP